MPFPVRLKSAKEKEEAGNKEGNSGKWLNTNLQFSMKG
jgi:hypothetical protein